MATNRQLNKAARVALDAISALSTDRRPGQIDQTILAATIAQGLGLSRSRGRDTAVGYIHALLEQGRLHRTKSGHIQISSQWEPARVAPLPAIEFPKDCAQDIADDFDAVLHTGAGDWTPGAEYGWLIRWFSHGERLKGGRSYERAKRVIRECPLTDSVSPGKLCDWIRENIVFDDRVAVRLVRAMVGSKWIDIDTCREGVRVIPKKVTLCIARDPSEFDAPGAPPACMRRVPGVYAACMRRVSGVYAARTRKSLKALPEAIPLPPTPPIPVPKVQGGGGGVEESLAPRPVAHAFGGPGRSFALTDDGRNASGNNGQALTDNGQALTDNGQDPEHVAADDAGDHGTETAQNGPGAARTPCELPTCQPTTDRLTTAREMALAAHRLDRYVAHYPVLAGIAAKLRAANCGNVVGELERLLPMFGLEVLP